MSALGLLGAAAATTYAPTGITSLTRVDMGQLPSALAIETASYPADEAASEEKLSLRIRQAQDYFWGAFSESTLRGFVCGTLSSASELTDESMSTHEAEGTTLCIHSVVVDEPFRRKGLATWMLRGYIDRIKEVGKATRVVLICKQHLLGFYESCGFTNRGPSDIGAHAPLHVARHPKLTDVAFRSHGSPWPRSLVPDGHAHRVMSVESTGLLWAAARCHVLLCGARRGAVVPLFTMFMFMYTCTYNM